MSTPRRNAPAPLVDWTKAIASQLIVWHHLVWYGPMAVAAHVLAPELVDWLRDSARIAVQAFLVVGGFLAARSLMPRPWHMAGPRPVDLPGLLVKRYGRLAKPYCVALLLAVLSAAAARALIQDADTPPLPTWAQVLANLTFTQDIAGLPALSAGVWYVAIDMQLFATLALLACLARWGLPGSRLNRCARLVSLLGTLGLVLASLLWFNLRPGDDAWAPYFMGSYGLGVLAQWIQPQQRRSGLLLALAAVVLLALWVEWRTRIAVAGLIALALACNLGAGWLGRHPLRRIVAWLAKVSYALFLVHYPVALLVGALVHRSWPGQPWPNAWGLLAAWGLSLLTAAWLHLTVEQPRSAMVRSKGVPPLLAWMGLR